MKTSIYKTCTLFRVLIPLLLLALYFPGCTPAREIVTQPDVSASSDFDRYFPAILGDYLSYKTPKAIAVARGPDGRFAFAYRIMAGSRDAAVERAMDECRKRAGWLGIEAPCKLYAVDNEVVEDGGPEEMEKD